MPLSVGQLLKGRIATYAITKALKDTSVFQAKIVPTSTLSQKNTTDVLVTIKDEPVDKPQRSAYYRELRNYDVGFVARSPYIRARIDLVGHKDSHDAGVTATQPRCMVFEWMDTDLWQLPSEPFRSGSKLPKMIAKSILQALAVFQESKGVHGDVNPNNVFVTRAHRFSPIVKLGDLGCLVVAGEMTSRVIMEGKIDYRYQGLHIRAPEVWRGIGIFHSTDIWSLGVTLAHWLASKVIFGPSDKIIQDMTAAWCMAKMIRLVGPLGDPAKPEYEEEFATAEFLEKETFVHPDTGVEERFVKLGSIRQELEAVSGPRIEEGSIAFIESLLVMDHTKRPTAREALGHPWLEDIDGGEVD
ncbi:MAG: hypothetical protein M1836_002653 [Candelina mexicana]|nr:MAG: hypothetical protein M1836_002653 [Candelina mexicana]